MRWEEHVGMHGEKRTAYGILAGKPGGKRSLGRTRCRKEDKSKINHREIAWGHMNCTNLAMDREMVMDLRASSTEYWKVLK
jgi:hypothetical protein